MSGLKHKQGIQLKHTQTLAVTPQMTQRLHILQCNQQQLETEIQRMLDKNIMLDHLEEITFDLDTELDFETAVDVLPTDIEDNPELDMEWEQIYDDDYLESFDKKPKKLDDVEGFQDDWVADELSFDRRIEQAIYLSPLNNEEQHIAHTILTHLNDEYFLDTPTEQLSKVLGVEQKHLEYVIDIIKHLDPPGVASQGVRDCLLAQLQSKGDNSETAINAHEILSEYYDYIDKKPDFIRKRLLLTENEYTDALQLIRGLSPYPCPTLTSTAQLIKPEVFVRKRMGMFYASQNQDARYDLAVNESYANLTDSCRGDEKRFMKAQLQEAKFFLDALDQRHKTVVRVANAIVMLQQDYFIEGEKAMRPLAMREIAEQLELSESTISRAVSGKYLSFNQQLIELRYFFAQGLSNTEANGSEIFGDDPITSSTAAKAHIKEIIESEPSKKPFSDKKIELFLKERGIDISRRTVSKYREALGIPKTSLRKRLH